jgi:hypothetical protein
MSHGPIEAQVRMQMNAVASAIDDTLPEGYGFALLVFEFGEAGRMNYISNAPRQDMICALKELVANFEGRGHEAPQGVQ